MNKPDRLSLEGINCIGTPKDISGITFSEGQMLQFRLIANPTKIVTEQTEGKRKVRVPLIKPDQQTDWLKRHLSECAEVSNCVTQNESPLYFNRNGKAGKIVPVRFEGNISIINPQKFKEQVYDKYELLDGVKRYIAGIGPAKAFGCGLLLVKPV